MRRRDLLIGTGAVLGASSLAGARTSAAPYRPLLRQETAPPRLVLIDLNGGNDGLNTVVPHGDPAYHRARPKLALGASDLQVLDERVALHGSMERLAARARSGRLGVIHGVGYPNPNLSHFKSGDIWDTGRLDGRHSGPGWIGRLAAARHPGAPHPDRLIHVGKSLPYSMYTPEHPAVAFAATRDYRFVKRGNTLGRVTVESEPSGRSRLDFLRGVMHDARASSAAVRSAIEQHVASVEYPNTELGVSLSMVAGLLASPVACEVLSVEHGGFDTHDDQLGRHANQLGQLDGALGAFLEELDAMPQAARTLVVVFSEFGRRVAENGSGGTDHGTAGPVLVAGPAANSGQLGTPCDLDDLDERGNLRFTTDFRRIWSAVVGDLFGASVPEVLGGRFRPLPIVARA